MWVVILKPTKHFPMSEPLLRPLHPEQISPHPTPTHVCMASRLDSFRFLGKCHLSGEALPPSAEMEQVSQHVFSLPTCVHFT